MVDDQFPPQTIQIVTELIDANECGVALEIMSEMLVDSKASISRDLLRDVERLVEVMRMERVNVDRLHPLVDREPPGP